MTLFPTLLSTYIYYNYRRAHIPNLGENFNSGNIGLKESILAKQHPRPPLAVLAQNVCNVDGSKVFSMKDTFINGNDTNNYIRRNVCPNFAVNF